MKRGLDQCDTGGHRVTTNANGEYSFRVPRDIVRQLLPTCVELVRPVPASRTFDRYAVAHIAFNGGYDLRPDVWPTGLPVLRLLVTATPAQRSVPLGGRIRIDGNVRPNRAGTRVILQRRRVDGWVPEATAIIRASGRYTIYATPPREGTFRYRVYNGGNRFLALLTGRSQEMLLIAN